MTMINGPDYEVFSDGKTVWVNKALCVGRFSKFGIDVHNDAEGQMAGKQCLDCTHTTPTLDDWERFKKGMLEHHGAAVGNEHLPRFVRMQASKSV